MRMIPKRSIYYDCLLETLRYADEHQLFELMRDLKNIEAVQLIANAADAHLLREKEDFIALNAEEILPC